MPSGKIAIASSGTPSKTPDFTHLRARVVASGGLQDRGEPCQTQHLKPVVGLVDAGEQAGALGLALGGLSCDGSIAVMSGLSWQITRAAVR